MENSLNKANVLTLQDLEAFTISRNISTAITDSRASTNCVHPTEEQMQMQEPECGLYTWDNPLSETNQQSDKIIQTERGDIAPGEDVVHLNALSLI